MQQTISVDRQHFQMQEGEWLTLCMLGNFCSLQIIFYNACKQFQNNLSGIPSLSKSLNPDQVGTDMDQNCFYQLPFMKKFLALSLSDVIFIMLINVKMRTIVGILTFMSMINFMLG